MGSNSKVLSIAALRKICEAEACGITFADACKSVGAGESTGRMWMTRSRQDAVANVGPTSSFFFQWRGKGALLHQHYARARMDRIERLENQVVSSVTEGREKPLFVGTQQVFEQDAALLAEFGHHGDDARDICEISTGFQDYPFKHRLNADGKPERVPVMVKEYPAASLIQKVLSSNVDQYRDQIDANVKHSGFVSVQQFPSKPKAVVIAQTPALLEAKAKARAYLESGGRTTAPPRGYLVPIARVSTEDDKQERITARDGMRGVSTPPNRPPLRDPLANADPYAAPKPDYSRPAPKDNDPAPERRPPENIGRGVIPPGGFKVR